MKIPAWLSMVLKIAVAVIVLAVMFRSGKLHPEVIAQAAHRWPLLLATAAMMCATILITAQRWRVLLAGHDIHLDFGHAASLTWIGMLFSTVIPGAVSGDLVKGYYVAQHAQGKRALALATILMDRILGLAALATVATAGVVWNRDVVFGNHLLAVLGAGAVAGCIGGVFGLLLAVRAGDTVLRMANRLPAGLPARGLFVRVAEVLAAHRDQIPRMAAAYFMSFPVHALGIGMMLACIHAVDAAQDVPAALLLFAVPLGLLATAIPITPAGVGVGQAAFYAVCNLALKGSGSAGANAFTVYQAVIIPVYLLGLIPYVMHRRELKEE